MEWIVRRIEALLLRHGTEHFFRQFARRIEVYLSKPEYRALEIHCLRPVHCEVGSEYTLYSNDVPLEFCAAFDFSSSRDGDRFQIDVYHAIGDVLRLKDSYMIEGQLAAPLCELPFQFAPGVEIRLTQQVGLERTVIFELWGRLVKVEPHG